MPCLFSSPILHELTKIYVFAMQASSGGDNAELIGTGPSVQEEVLDGDSSGSDLEAINCKGDSSSESEGNSSDEANEDRYKDLEELFGKENPVLQGIKIAIEYKEEAETYEEGYTFRYVP